MHLSALHKMLRNKVNIHEFKKSIQDEVFEYSKNLKKKGSSASIKIEEDTNLYFGKDDLLQLCYYYLDNNLTAIDISYIADCLTLSDSVAFENDELREFLEEITDPEVNGRLTKKRILSIIKAVK